MSHDSKGCAVGLVCKENLTRLWRKALFQRRLSRWNFGATALRAERRNASRVLISQCHTIEDLSFGNLGILNGGPYVALFIGAASPICGEILCKLAKWFCASGFSRKLRSVCTLDEVAFTLKSIRPRVVSLVSLFY